MHSGSSDVKIPVKNTREMAAVFTYSSPNVAIHTKQEKHPVIHYYNMVAAIYAFLKLSLQCTTPFKPVSECLWIWWNCLTSQERIHNNLLNGPEWQPLPMVLPCAVLLALFLLLLLSVIFSALWTKINVLQGSMAQIIFHWESRMHLLQCGSLLSIAKNPG